MPTIELQPTGRKIDTAAGVTLLDAAKEAGVEIETPCGGLGSCGRCLARITKGRAGPDSVGRLPAQALEEGYVLACLTHVCDDDLVVELPEPPEYAVGEVDPETEQLVQVSPQI